MVSPTFSITSWLNSARPAIEKGEKVTLDLPIRNVNRTAGTVLSSKIAKKYGLEGCRKTRSRSSLPVRPDNRSAHSLRRGITLTLEGESNDYIGKGLSGGKIIVFPPKQRSL